MGRARWWRGSLRTLVFVLVCVGATALVMLEPERSPIEETLMLARREAWTGNTTSAVLLLEAARTSALAEQNQAMLRKVALDAETIAFFLVVRSDDQGVADSLTVAYDLYIELVDDDEAKRIRMLTSSLAKPQ
jgi:hypothetical protein